jgi:hypothetical protein
MSGMFVSGGIGGVGGSGLGFIIIISSSPKESEGGSGSIVKSKRVFEKF